MDKGIARVSVRPRRATLFGKVPAALDFVRVHHETQEAIALDQWVQAAMQQLAQHGASWPKQRFRFVFRPKGCSRSIVGVIGPSRDRANRKFPVVVSAPLPSERAQCTSAGTLLGAERFLDHAERLLEMLPAWEPAEWTRHVDALSPPLDEEIEQAAQRLEIEVSKSSAAGLLSGSVDPRRSLDDGHLAESVAHALRDMRAHGADRPLVLDCSPRSTIAVAMWVTVLQQALPSLEGAPSVFWSTEESTPRMLLSLGAPAALVPLWLADDRAKNQRLRPLFPARVLHPAAPASSAQDGEGVDTQSVQHWLTALGRTLRDG